MITKKILAIIFMTSLLTLAQAQADESFSDQDSLVRELDATAASDSVDADEMESIQCAARCIDRTFANRCNQRGADFCAMGPGVACVPKCFRRSFATRCSDYAMDYCGVYPSCAPHCIRPGVNGNCSQWGEDVCASWYLNSGLRDL